MKAQNVASLFIDGLKTVNVVFASNPLRDPTVLIPSKYYTYKTTFDFEAGDLAVVDAQGMMKVVTIIEVHEVPQIDFDAKYKYKWIVSKIDVTTHNELVAKEKQITDEFLKKQQKLAIERAKQEFMQDLSEAKFISGVSDISTEDKSDEPNEYGPFPF